MRRRDVLAALTAVPLLLPGGRLHAAPRGAAKLLVVNLRGGYDAASLLMPTSGVLANPRPTIAIAPPGSGPASAIALDDEWALHPALVGSMLPLYRAGELAFVPFAGATGVGTNHLVAQDAVDSAVRDLAAAVDADVLDAGNGRAWSTGAFAADAPTLANTMLDRADIATVSLDGWDTHVDQGAATGHLAARFSELGAGLASFRREMGSAWNRTVVVVVSEFGRTLRENGNRGTDHGAGTVYWVLGGAVRGGQLLGEQQQVDAALLATHRSLPVLNDRRQVLGGLFAQIHGLSAARVERAFPGVTPGGIRFV